MKNNGLYREITARLVTHGRVTVSAATIRARGWSPEAATSNFHRALSRRGFSINCEQDTRGGVVVTYPKFAKASA